MGTRLMENTIGQIRSDFMGFKMQYIVIYFRYKNNKYDTLGKVY